MFTLVNFIVLITTIQWNYPVEIEATPSGDFYTDSSNTASDVSPRKTTMAGYTYLGSMPASLARRGDNSQNYFTISDDKIKWFNAFNKCKDEMGGRLLSIETKAKESKISDFLLGYTLTNVWTSGRYDKGKQKWIWLTSRQELNYTNFKPKEVLKTESQRIAFINVAEPYWESLVETNNNHYICEFSDTAETCKTTATDPISLAVVLDGSLSVDRDGGAGSFQKAKEFVRQIAETLLSQAGPKFTFVVYADTAKVEIPFSNKFTWDELVKKILGAAYPKGNTYTNLGIDAAIKELGNAPNKHMIVLTDGISNQAENTKVSSHTARKNGIKMFAVGIGNYNEAELLTIAGDVSRRFTSKNFEELRIQLVPLTTSVCNGNGAGGPRRSGDSAGAGGVPSMRSRNPNCKKRKSSRGYKD